MTLKGRFEDLERCALLPRPRRNIPIYCGGNSEHAFCRAARLADGFVWSGTLEQALQGWSLVQEHLHLAGRPVDVFGSQYVAMEGGFDGVGWRWAGTEPAAAVAAVGRWGEAQGNVVSIQSMGRGYTTADEHIDYFAEVKRRFDAQ